MFYSHWNGFINMSCQDFGKGMLVDGSEQIAQKKLFYKNSFPIFLIDSTSIAFFNFNEGRIEFLDPDGKLKKTVVLSIHDLKSNNMADTLDPSWWGWKWDWQIIQDQKNLNIYTTFHQGNRTRIQKIDLKTGCLTKFFELQYPFPKNIQIYNGEVFFLSREPGLEDRWKLISYAF
ncbi:MAG TPA: hypothetical protein PK892_14330 [Bacteroidales bacterium]|nr:hypothetical protein [Bacteroidales bacterium]